LKTFLYILLIGILFSSFKKDEKKITAELANIEYYSKGICKDTTLIYVRVLYKVKGEKLELLKMKHNFPNGISSTMPVTEINKKGNPVYAFCIGHSEIKEFSTVFISSEGKTSNRIFIKINVPDAEIIPGTAPETLKFKK